MKKILLFIPVLLLSCSRESKIKSALNAEKVVSYSPASHSAPDSLTATALFSRYSALADDAKKLIGVGAELSLAPVKDSLSMLAAEIEAAKARIEKAGPSPATFTVCRYIPSTANAQKQTDTLTAVLDENMRVVWPH